MQEIPTLVICVFFVCFWFVFVVVVVVVVVVVFKCNVGLHSDIYRPISFKLGMMVEITGLYILISVWMTLTFFQGHSRIRNQKPPRTFSRKFLN